ncbi:MAG: 2'-5' RNA ligase family protein, partial [Candidatus Kapaibacterium sp.]
MNAVITLLDEETQHRLRTIWSSLRKDVGGTGVATTPFPHFSYQIAERYEVDSVSAVLERVAARQRPFTVRTAGLGIFTGPVPVLFLSLVKSIELIRLHEEIWEELRGDGTDISDLYRPDRWAPHVTLFQGSPDNQRLPDIVKALSGDDFAGEI